MILLWNLIIGHCNIARRHFSLFFTWDGASQLCWSLAGLLPLLNDLLSARKWALHPTCPGLHLTPPCSLPVWLAVAKTLGQTEPQLPHWFHGCDCWSEKWENCVQRLATICCYWELGEWCKARPPVWQGFIELVSLFREHLDLGHFASHKLISPERRETGWVSRLCIPHKNFLCFFSLIHTSGCTYCSKNVSILLAMLTIQNMGSPWGRKPS